MCVESGAVVAEVEVHRRRLPLLSQGSPPDPARFTTIDLVDDDALWTGGDGLGVVAERIRSALGASPPPTTLIVDSAAALAAPSGDPDSLPFLAFLARSSLGADAATVVLRGDGLQRGGRARAALAAAASSLLALEPLPSGAAPDVAAVLTATRIGGETEEGGGAAPAVAAFSVRGADARLTPRPGVM